MTVAGGQPVAATAELDTASIRTGIRKRDVDLAGHRFLHARAHPRLRIGTVRVRPDGDGWAADSTLAVAGASAPLDLHVTRLPDPAPGTVRIRLTGVLDRTGTPVRARTG